MRSTTCESCSKTFDVEDRFAGLFVRCPRCGAVGRQPVGTAEDVEARAMSASGTLFVVPNHRAGPNDSTRLNLATLGESTRLATPTLSKMGSAQRPRPLPEPGVALRPSASPSADGSSAKPAVKFNDTTVPVLKRVAAKAGQDDALARTVEVRHGNRALLLAILVGVLVGTPVALWVLAQARHSATDAPDQPTTASHTLPPAWPAAKSEPATIQLEAR